MILNDGCWNGQRLLPSDYVKALHTPSPVFSNYGYLWWLNTDLKQYSNAPESSFFAVGAGSNVIWIDGDLDLVAVVRWISQPKINDWVAKVMAAIQD